MEGIKQAIAHTPWWVFLLFAYLFRLGIRARKARVVSLVKIAVAPAFFATWSLWSLMSQIGISLEKGAVWLGSLVLGTIIGWLLTGGERIKADRIKALIALPGSWAPLCLMLLIFSVRYAFSYLYATDDALRLTPAFYYSDTAVSGAIIGLFIGRFGRLFYKYQKAPHTDLVPSR